MAKTLDEFVKEVKEEIDSFAMAYRSRSEIEGEENYPLALEDDNEGLWREFFFMYLDGGV